jgi:beta-lactamase regulating signal transducer with metallopeptidase domain
MKSTKMLKLPQVVLWAAGAVAAFALAQIARREYRRVNKELEEARLSPAASKAEPAEHPTLRRDPTTGVYRP